RLQGEILREKAVERGRQTDSRVRTESDRRGREVRRMKLIAELRHYADVDASDVHDHHQLIIGVTGAMDLQLAGKETVISSMRGAIVPAGARPDFLVDGPHTAPLVDLHLPPPP